MNLLLPALVSGLTVGLLYGLFGLVVAVLYRATGLVNFAVGGLATASVFAVWELQGPRGWSLPAAVVCGALVASALGATSYVGTMTLRDRAGVGNRIMRTLALLMLLQAIVQDRWGQGQPFALKLTFLPGDIDLGVARIPGASVAAVVLALIVVAGGALIFEKTSIGLQLRAVADNRDAATLVGIRTRLVTGVAWAGASVVAFLAGLLAAPDLLVSTYMFDGLMLFAFTAVVCAGLTSLGGSLLIGVVVGVVSTVAAVYLGPEFAVIAVFATLLGALLLRPQGLFGRVVQERL